MTGRADGCAALTPALPAPQTDVARCQAQLLLHACFGRAKDSYPPLALDRHPHCPTRYISCPGGDVAGTIEEIGTLESQGGARVPAVFNALTGEPALPGALVRSAG